MTDFPLELTRPTWLLAAVVVLPLLFFGFRRSLVDFPRAQRAMSLVVRSLVAVLLLLALAGLTLRRSTDELFVVFALDESLSVGDEGHRVAQSFLRQTIPQAGGNEVRVLSFAVDPGELIDAAEYLELLDRSAAEPANSQATTDDPRSRGSDLSAAIVTALASAPPDRVARVVLLSDGNETSGDVLRTAAGGEVAIDVVPLPVRSDPEVQVSSVRVPAQVAQGEPFYVEVAIDSNHDDEVTIEVYRGSFKVVEESKTIEAGENVFRFRQTIDRDRLAEYSVRIRGAKQDTLLDNNAADGLVYAAGKPRVLLIESNPDLARNLTWALEEEDVLVDLRPARGIPENLSDLQNYEMLVLSNVPATDLTSRQMDVVRSYVRDLGGGFVMLGGDQSFGLGGYYKTPLEEILPVRSDFEKEKEKPSLAMVLIIDKSGSMGGQKIELAKEAAKSAVELLGAKDQIGVLAFEGNFTWVSEVRPKSGAVIDRIATIEAGGGTSLAPAMDEALAALRSATAKLKHVIILSDGMSSPGDFEGIAASMAASQITCSTVGIGEGAHQQLLENIAQIGKGRYYFTNDPFNIPQIFAKETVTASKGAINEEPFLPQILRPTPVLDGIDLETAPFLLGYVVTRPKGTAEVILSSETGDPLLAWWRYGLGMSVAFTSDAKGRWAAEWLTWPGFGKFWAQIVRHAMRTSESKGFVTTVERRGKHVSLTLDAATPDGRFLNDVESTLTLIDPRLGDRRLTLAQVAPGRYAAEFDVTDPGAYHLELSQSQQGQTLYRQSRGLVVGYPDELRLRPTNESLLRRVAATTGGRYAVEPGDVFAPPERTAVRREPLWPYLVMAALALWVLDVALRRIDFSLLMPRRLNAA